MKRKLGNTPEYLQVYDTALRYPVPTYSQQNAENYDNLVKEVGEVYVKYISTNV